MQMNCQYYLDLTRTRNALLYSRFCLRLRLDSPRFAPLFLRWPTAIIAFNSFVISILQLTVELCSPFVQTKYADLDAQSVRRVLSADFFGVSAFCDDKRVEKPSTAV